jgi:hypothetical protein
MPFMATRDPTPQLRFRYRELGLQQLLFMTITGSDGSVVGKGILHLSLQDFVSELRSLRSRTSVGAISDMQA